MHYACDDRNGGNKYILTCKATHSGLRQYTAGIGLPSSSRRKRQIPPQTITMVTQLGLCHSSLRFTSV